jgi:hypothetical protein
MKAISGIPLLLTAAVLWTASCTRASADEAPAPEPEPAPEAAAPAPAEAPAVAPAWREEFGRWNKAWDVRGKPGTRRAEFEVTEEAEGAAAGGLLRMSADRASASLMIPVEGVNLKDTPILRWRWRVTTFPEGADGRDSAKDDQAIGVYIGMSRGFGRQSSLAYRWETDTPRGADGQASYGAGLVRVHWHALRNQEDGEGVFFEESRNVAKDFEAAFGTVPDAFALSISCNSQYTGTRAVAELDWIEFVR